MGIGFRFRLIPFVATVLLVALGLALGQWQDRRAAFKTARQDKLTAQSAAAPLVLGPTLVAAAPLEYRRVAVTGRFVAQWPLFLNNRPLQGHAGFYLLMPFRIDGSDTHVLVARGWLPRTDPKAGSVPAVTTPDGMVTIEGVVKTGLGHIMELGVATPVTPGALLQNIELTQLAKASGMTFEPFFIEQVGAAAPNEQLVRDWPAPSLGVDKHRGYAFQWYALAVMAFLFFVMTGFRRGTD
jgi:surfeit locus 1 family protein